MKLVLATFAVLLACNRVYAPVELHQAHVIECSDNHITVSLSGGSSAEYRWLAGRDAGRDTPYCSTWNYSTVWTMRLRMFRDINNVTYYELESFSPEAYRP